MPDYPTQEQLDTALDEGRKLGGTPDKRVVVTITVTDGVHINTTGRFSAPVDNPDLIEEILSDVREAIERAK